MKEERQLQNLKRENGILRRENALLREQLILNISSQKGTESKKLSKKEKKAETNVDALQQVIELQRQRINNLELECDAVQRRYDEMVAQVTDKEKGRNPVYLELQEYKRRCEVLEEKLSGMTQTYGKEIASLKGKVSQQDAQILLNDKAPGLGISKSPHYHKSGVPLNKKQSRVLQPIEGVHTYSAGTLKGSDRSQSIGPAVRDDPLSIPMGQPKHFNPYR